MQFSVTITIDDLVSTGANTWLANIVVEVTEPNGETTKWYLRCDRIPGANEEEAYNFAIDHVQVNWAEIRGLAPKKAASIFVEHTP